MKVIHEELDYDHCAADVFALISSAGFQMEIASHLGGRDPVVLEDERRPDGSVRLVVRQQADVELPGFARRAMPAGTTVTHTFEWAPVGPDGNRPGRWSVEARDTHISIGGSAVLRPRGRGSVHVYHGEISATMPIIGGKIESFTLDNLQRDLARTRLFVAQRLELQRPQARHPTT